MYFVKVFSTWWFFGMLKNWFGLEPSKVHEIVLTHGVHDVTFHTRWTPEMVWVNMETPADCVPVCQGGQNCVSTSIVDRGFILHADVKTDCCVIRWFVTR